MGRPRKPADIVATFRKARVLTLEQLTARLSISRATVLRRLSEHGYYSSYNHRGMFLTIEEVAEFDSQGLWISKEARFSRLGTLKETTAQLVEASERGLTHEELSTLLGVRVHNTLLDLVEQKRVRRCDLGPSFVYLSPKARRRREQTRRRASWLAEHPKARATSQQVIAILLELIKDPKASQAEIARRASRAGLKITRALVDGTFDAYELDKKRAPSRSSSSSRQSGRGPRRA